MTIGVLPERAPADAHGAATVGAFLVSAPVDVHRARGHRRPTREHADGRLPSAPIAHQRTRQTARQRTHKVRAAVVTFLVSAQWTLSMRAAVGSLPTRTLMEDVPPRTADGTSAQACQRRHPERAATCAFPASEPTDSPPKRGAVGGLPEAAGGGPRPPGRGTVQMIMTVALSVGVWDNRGRKRAPQKTSGLQAQAFCLCRFRT